MVVEPTGSNQPPADAAPATQGAAPPARVPTTPAYRRLRTFTFDPLLSNQLDTFGINQITLPVVWEDGLGLGPTGEYLEVVDRDPAGDCYSAPVDLDSPRLLATDGLAPSEGNRQFHQQMVYAGAMITIRRFEQGLG